MLLVLSYDPTDQEVEKVFKLNVGLQQYPWDEKKKSTDLPFQLFLPTASWLDGLNINTPNKSTSVE